MNKTTTLITQHTNFDLDEFQSRWLKARISALRAALGGGDGAFSEEQLLQQVSAETRDLVLRRVFDHSRHLGQSVVRYLGMTWEVADLVDILPRMGAACFSGRWLPHNEAHVLDRGGCSSLSALGSFGCDYWREALDGLVMGVGENERLARHRSKGHGDASCLDVLFTEEYVAPRVVSADTHCTSSGERLKYGPIPGEMIQALEPLRKRFEAMKVRALLEGLSEGILYYRLEAEEGVLCGAGGKLMHDSFASALAQRYPTLVPRDAGPVAVYGGSS